MRMVLLAEERAIVTKAVEIMLETEFPDYQLEIVKNTPMLLDALKHRSFNLVIINDQMDEGAVRPLIQQLRSDHPGYTFLIYTGYPWGFLRSDLNKVKSETQSFGDDTDEKVIKAMKETLNADLPATGNRQ